MRNLILVLLLQACNPAFAQSSGGIFKYLRFQSTSLPAVCVNGDIRFDGAKLQYCVGGATWVPFFPLSTSGGMLYMNSSSLPAELTIGTAGQILTVNPSTGYPYWANNAAANTSLSNLSSVALNTTVYSALGTGLYLETQNQSANTAADPIVIQGGLASGGGAATSVTIQGGSNSAAAAGTVNLNGGAGTSGSTGGHVYISGGASDTGIGGGISITSGYPASGSAASGSVAITSGSANGNTGAATMSTGNAGGAGTSSGAATINTGNNSTSTGTVGAIYLTLGTNSSTTSSATAGVIDLQANNPYSQVNLQSTASHGQINLTANGTTGIITETAASAQNDFNFASAGYINQVGARYLSNDQDSIIQLRPDKATLNASTGSYTAITNYSWTSAKYAAAKIEYTLQNTANGDIQVGTLYVAQNETNTSSVSSSQSTATSSGYAAFPTVNLEGVLSSGNIVIKYTNAGTSNVYMKALVTLYPL